KRETMGGRGRRLSQMEVDRERIPGSDRSPRQALLRGFDRGGVCSGWVVPRKRVTVFRLSGTPAGIGAHQAGAGIEREKAGADLRDGSEARLATARGGARGETGQLEGAVTLSSSRVIPNLPVRAGMDRTSACSRSRECFCRVTRLVRSLSRSLRSPVRD